jgi:hypothetical protein
MTAISPADAVTPLPAAVPPEQGHAEVSTRTRTREDGHASPGQIGMLTKMVPAALAGGSLWDAQPPSLAQIWARHCASAKFYRAGALKGPRYVWGWLHLALAAFTYFVAWVTHSLALLAVASVLLGLGFWLHVF